MAARTMEYSEELASSAPPNSCCEYTNLKGEQKSVLQCLCACDEVDETFDAMVNGKEIKDGKWDQMMAVVSDRVRVPWFGGAVKVSAFFFVCPLYIHFCLLVASFSFKATVVTVSAMMVGVPLYISWKSMKSARQARSKLLMHWTNWSVGMVIFHYFRTTRPLSMTCWERLPCDLVGAGVCWACWSIHRARLGAVTSIEKPEHHGSESLLQYYLSHRGRRLKYCRITDRVVEGYDHYCIWIGSAVGKANHRMFVALLLFLSSGGFLFSSHASGHMLAGHSLVVLYQMNHSNYTLAMAYYAFVASTGIFLLFVHHCILIARGLTSYEATHLQKLSRAMPDWRKHGPAEDRGVAKNCMRFWCPKFLTKGERGLPVD